MDDFLKIDPQELLNWQYYNGMNYEPVYWDALSFAAADRFTLYMLCYMWNKQNNLN